MRAAAYIENSIKRRKPLFGIGINDAPYITNPRTKGVRSVCPYYTVWRDMLRRAYDLKFHKINPAYCDVTVCREWHYFVEFRKWMEKHNWKGKTLDKDIIIPGNKIYSPDACCFVEKKINCLMSAGYSGDRKFPTGVYPNKGFRGFYAVCGYHGKQKYLGYFYDVDEASVAYRKFKAAYIIEMADNQTDARIAGGLKRHAQLILGT